MEVSPLFDCAPPSTVLYAPDASRGLRFRADRRGAKRACDVPRSRTLFGRADAVKHRSRGEVAEWLKALAC